MRGTIVGLWEWDASSVLADGEPAARRMIVEYAPGHKLDVGAGVACRAAGVATAVLARAREILIGRRVSFLACHSGNDHRGGGQWIAANLDLDEERAHSISNYELPQRGEYVYAIGLRDFESIKIGTSGQLHARLRALQSASAEPLLLHALIPGDLSLERELHRRFAALRIHGEWFTVDEHLATALAPNRLTPPLPLLNPGGPISSSMNDPALPSILAEIHDSAMRMRPRAVALAQASRRATANPVHLEFAAVDAAAKSVLRQRPDLSATVVAHILCGSRGPMTTAAGAGMPEYAQFASVAGTYGAVHAIIRDRVADLVAR